MRGTGTMMPIIMLTARGDEVDRIIGLEMGADDYLPKPFNPRELLARMNAVLRRHGRLQPNSTAVNSDHVTIGEFVFNASTRSLTKDGASITITSGEFALLKVFVDHPRQPLSRDKLMQLARGRELDVFDRSIDVQVSRLRKLIEPDAAHPRYLQTMWGFGYVFIPDGETD
jgi:two-component system phosphate regulon response regulator OmpR